MSHAEAPRLDVPWLSGSKFTRMTLFAILNGCCCMQVHQDPHAIGRVV